MIDNGSIFNGRHWNFPDSVIQHLYIRPKFHSTPASLIAIDLWIQGVKDLPESVIEQALQKIPSDWLDGEEQALAQLTDELLARQKRIAGLIADALIAT